MPFTCGFEGKNLAKKFPEQLFRSTKRPKKIEKRRIVSFF
jgi:hypothetical protein